MAMAKARQEKDGTAPHQWESRNMESKPGCEGGMKDLLGNFTHQGRKCSKAETGGDGQQQGEITLEKTIILDRNTVCGGRAESRTALPTGRWRSGGTLAGGIRREGEWRLTWAVDQLQRWPRGPQESGEGGQPLDRGACVRKLDGSPEEPSEGWPGGSVDFGDSRAKGDWCPETGDRVLVDLPQVGSFDRRLKKDKGVSFIHHSSQQTDSLNGGTQLDSQIYVDR
ncbi:hypothetical protein C8J57DRAFT_1252503 [Mycena rebaudengoi]|nr:hypothetical protein C8J57DRAFT_1252503 [Mycena rebaudengoi]